MSNTLTQATPQERQTHEDLLKTTKENIIKGEVRLKENKAKKMEHLQAQPQDTTTHTHRGRGGGRRGRRGTGRDRPPPRTTRGTPYPPRELEELVKTIIGNMEQRRGGRPPYLTVPPVRALIGDAPMAPVVLVPINPRIFVSKSGHTYGRQQSF